MKFVDTQRDVSSFQQHLSEKEINTLCRQAFGRFFKAETYQLLESGKFNTSYKIGCFNRDSVILRVAPPAQAIIFRHEKHLLRRESAVQKLLNRTSEKIPRNLFVDFSRRHIDRDYVFQNCLPGVLWDDIKTDLSHAENNRLWFQLGSIVRKIHSVPGTKFGPSPPALQFDCWSDAMISWLSHMHDDMQNYHLPCEDVDDFLRIVKAGRRHLDKVVEPKLVHGDLWQRNILIRRDRDAVEISAVLDAERAFWGDPEAEWIFTFLDIPASFWQSYGSLKTDNSAKFRRLVYEGRGAIQLCLEAWRFRFDDSFFRGILQRASKELSNFDT